MSRARMCFHIALTTLALVAGASAQSPTSVVTLEREAFELKGQGRYAEAESRFVELCARASGGQRGAALAEFHAVLAHLMARRTGNPDARSALAKLADSEFAQEHPMLRDRALHLVLDLDRSRGDAARAAATSRELGYIDRWWFLGPLANERGSGYGVAFGPESAFDLDATIDGKKRPVRWRRSPITAPPDGVFDLDAIARPNDQVLCFAAVALLAERARDLVLHLGSDESFRVFLNGREVGARDVRRRFAPDQDAFRLPLRAGANLLLLKVCDQEGPFAFAARLREPDGRAVRGVEVSDDEADLRAAARPLAASEPHVSSEGESLFRGALSVFAAPTADPRDAFRLGLMLALNQPDDPNTRRDHQLARRAVELEPDFATARYLLAFTRVRTGSAAEREENARRRDYETILATHPDHAEALRSLAELEFEGTKLVARAEELLRRALAVNPDFANARSLLARVLREIDLDDLAEREAQRAARPSKNGHRPPGPSQTLFRQHVALNRFDDAEELVPGLLATSWSLSVVDDVVSLWLRCGKKAAARALLERARVMLPFARGPRMRLARLLEAERDIASANAMVMDWLAICPDDDSALVLAARLNGISGQRDRQRELLRLALELNPNRKAERRYLEFLEADEAPFYAGFVLDSDAILAADPGPPPDAADANDPYHHLLIQEVVRAYRNGTTSRYRHEVFRILTEEGARQMSTFVVRHFWGEQRARLLEVRVVQADGNVRRPRLSSSFVRLGTLAPGDRIAIRSRVDDLAPTFFGDYFGLVHGFASNDGSPVARSELVLALDPGRTYRFQSANGAPEATVSEAADGSAVHRFSMRDLPRRQIEERRPSWTESAPLVRVTTYGSWNDFAGWWWNLVRNQTEVSPAMRAKVRELTEGLTDEQAKIDAIYRFVTTEIRYEAWEFGVHGFKPYRTSVIFERRHGDCKDKSLLLNAMLGEVGITAYPVLIKADSPRSADDLSIPMVEHFNHCISYVPGTGDRPARYLDGTATYHPGDTLPDMDNGATVLVVENGVGKIRDIEWITAGANREIRRFEIALDRAGDATISLELRPEKNRAVRFRDLFGNEPGKRRENLERFLGYEFGDVEVIDFEFSDLLDLDQPVAIDVRFAVEDFAPVQQGGLALAPQLGGTPLQSLTAAPERRYPLLLGLPRSDDLTVRYRLPPGWEPLELPPRVRLDARFGSFELAWTRDNGDLVVERRRALDHPRIQPEEYAEFREFAIGADTADRRTVLVRGKQP